MICPHRAVEVSSEFEKGWPWVVTYHDERGLMSTWQAHRGHPTSMQPSSLEFASIKAFFFILPTKFDIRSYLPTSKVGCIVQIVSGWIDEPEMEEIISS
jgi:hypothetical protein